MNRKLGVAQALREHPSWARQTRDWLRVACWAYGYVEDDVPDRETVAKALAPAWLPKEEA